MLSASMLSRTPNCSNASMSTARTASSNWWSKIDKDNFLYAAPPADNPSFFPQLLVYLASSQHAFHIYQIATFQRHQAEIAASLEPVEKQLGVVSKALEQFDLQSHELYDLQVAIEGNIQQQLQELLEARKAELIDQLQQYIRAKTKNLAAQKD